MSPGTGEPAVPGDETKKEYRMSRSDNKKDVMKDVLSRAEGGAFYGEEDLLNIIYQAGQQQQKTAPKKAVKKRAHKRRKPKKKTTHYLSEDIFDTLGDAKEKLRDMLPEEKKSRISKSGIVNYALDMILKEFDAKGGGSLLVKKIKTHREKPGK